MFRGCFGFKGGLIALWRCWSPSTDSTGNLSKCIIAESLPSGWKGEIMMTICSEWLTLGKLDSGFGSKVVLSPASQGLVSPGCCPARGWLGFLWRMAEAGAWPWLAAPHHLRSLGKIGVAILLYSSPQPFLPPHITHFCKAPAGLPSRKTHTVRFVRISYFRLILDDLYDEYSSVLALWLLV